MGLRLSPATPGSNASQHISPRAWPYLHAKREKPTLMKVGLPSVKWECRNVEDTVLQGFRLRTAVGCPNKLVLKARRGPCYGAQRRERCSSKHVQYRPEDQEIRDKPNAFGLCPYVQRDQHQNSVRT